MKKLILSTGILFFALFSAFGGIRVMSYNIRQSKVDDGINKWSIRKVATPAMIYDIRPEIIGVQEAYREQLDYILEQCPHYKEVGVGREDGADGGEHMSAFYNTDSLKLIKWGNYWLSETPDRPSRGWDAKCKRTATWMLLEKKSTGKRFFFVNTHLDHKGVEARKNGLQLIYDKIKEMNPEGLPMILTGDFNVKPDNAGLNKLNTLMKSARFTATDTETKGSYNGFGKYGESDSPSLPGGAVSKDLLPIDYIYYSGFSSCPLFKVVFRTYAGVKYISDHYPIYADLEL